jgi:hypothetical protein
MKKILLAFPVVALLAAGCNSSQSVSTNSNPTPVVENANAAPTPLPAPTKTTEQKNTSTTTSTKTITLDAATKVAVVEAIMNSSDILASNDPVKIRNYFLTELQKPEQIAQFKALSDTQLLQIAAAATTNAGKPTADLATNPAAIWKIDGNTVTVTAKSYAKPNSDYPATAGLNVTYQAVYLNGAWY